MITTKITSINVITTKITTIFTITTKKNTITTSITTSHEVTQVPDMLQKLMDSKKYHLVVECVDRYLSIFDDEELKDITPLLDYKAFLMKKRMELPDIFMDELTQTCFNNFSFTIPSEHLGRFVEDKLKQFPDYDMEEITMDRLNKLLKNDGLGNDNSNYIFILVESLGLF